MATNKTCATSHQNSQTATQPYIVPKTNKKHILNLSQHTTPTEKQPTTKNHKNQSQRKKGENFVPSGECDVERQAYDGLVSELLRQYGLEGLTDEILVGRVAMYLIRIVRA